MYSSRSSSVPFSVGVPAFNQGAYLRATLDSLLCQTVAPLEIVVSDNYSTDETAAILREYKNRVRVIKPNTHLDMMAHWNFLVENLNGDWFSLLSSDDIAKPNYVEILLSGIARSNDAVLIRGGWESIDSNGQLIDKNYLLSVKAITSPPNTLYEQLQGPKVCFAAFAARKSAWRRVGGFPEDLKLAGDWGLWLKISPFGDFIRERKIISQYRNDYRPNLQKKRVVAWIRDELIISTKIIPHAAKEMQLINQELINKAKAKRFFQCLKLASQHLEASDHDDAVMVFNIWASEICLPLKNNNVWSKFVAGKVIRDDKILSCIKRISRSAYSFLRQMK